MQNNPFLHETILDCAIVVKKILRIYSFRFISSEFNQLLDTYFLFVSISYLENSLIFGLINYDVLQDVIFKYFFVLYRYLCSKLLRFLPCIFRCNLDLLCYKEWVVIRTCNKLHIFTNVVYYFWTQHKFGDLPITQLIDEKFKIDIDSNSSHNSYAKY